MIGTIDEVLLYITEKSEWAPLLRMSRQRLVGLRTRLKKNNLGEDYKRKLLFRLRDTSHAPTCRFNTMPIEVRLIRERYVLPAVVRDKHGKFFTELSLVKICWQSGGYEDLHLAQVYSAMHQGKFPRMELLCELLRRKGWTLFEARYEMPSVWEVD